MFYCKRCTLQRLLMHNYIALSLQSAYLTTEEHNDRIARAGLSWLIALLGLSGYGNAENTVRIVGLPKPQEKEKLVNDAVEKIRLTVRVVINEEGYRT